ncbi:hypothetical protein CRUP_029509 [Coryphaenoides rupestris]|nr:hypothetical protein CRUP_014870 [Coryphaenoides rupestris]KAG7256801.1 hypothetical protein CRUP_029509 [Coryphaenoides rupestris]
MPAPAAPAAPQPDGRKTMVVFLRSAVGVLRVLQIVSGAGLWVTIAANRYEGWVHFVLLVAVLFWLLTLALTSVTLLGKQDLVPVLGGDRWLLSNLLHDAVAAGLYLPAVGVLVYKTGRNSYCNLDQYQHLCLYRVYLTAAVFSVLGALLYLLSAGTLGCRRARGDPTLF